MTPEPMHDWARDLYPVCRSLTGAGVRETLAYLSGWSLDFAPIPSPRASAPSTGPCRTSGPSAPPMWRTRPAAG